MPCEILVKATDKPGGVWFKGDPVAVRDDAELVGHPWGGREGLPEYVILHVTDATAAQVQHRLDDWKREFDYEILAENSSGWRIRIFINPNIAAVLGIDKAFGVDMKNYLVSAWGAQVVSFDNVTFSEGTFDFPKPLMFEGEEKDLPDLKRDVVDKMEDALQPRRYYFSSSDVDLVVALGGRVDQTKAQVDSKVIDRLA